MLLGRLLSGGAFADPLAEQTILEGLKMVEDLQIKPLQAMGHLFLGETYAIAGQKEKALASLNKAREMCRRWAWTTGWPGRRRRWRS
jgi:protein involved in temperature-dependent protein secretion